MLQCSTDFSCRYRYHFNKLDTPRCRPRRFLPQDRSLEANMSGTLAYEYIIVPEGRFRDEVSDTMYTDTAKLSGYGQRRQRPSDIPLAFQELFSAPCIEDHAVSTLLCSDSGARLCSHRALYDWLNRVGHKAFDL